MAEKIKHDHNFELPDMVPLKIPKPPAGYMLYIGEDWKDGEQRKAYFFRTPTGEVHGPWPTKQGAKTLAEIHAEFECHGG